MVAVGKRFPDPGRDTLAVALAATLALLLILGGAAVLDAFRLDRQELHDALSTAPVSVHPPPGYRFWTIDLPGIDSAEVQGIVALLFKEDGKSSRYGGAPMVIQYSVTPSEEAARVALEQAIAGRREQIRGRGPRYFRQGTVPWLTQDHSCVRQSNGETYCQVVVGSVLLEALSRTKSLHLDDATHIRWLTTTAVDHLEDVAASSTLP